MTPNTTLYGAAKAQRDRHHPSDAKLLEPVFAYENVAFILDEAREALEKEHYMPCVSALRRIEEIARETLPLLEAQLKGDLLSDARDDIAQVRAARARYKRRVRRIFGDSSG